MKVVNSFHDWERREFHFTTLGTELSVGDKNEETWSLPLENSHLSAFCEHPPRPTPQLT